MTKHHVLPDNMPPADWQRHDDEGFFGLIGPVWQRWERDRLVLGLEAGARHANQGAMVQGGLLMTLADRVMGHALRLYLAGEPVATIQLDTHFLDAGHIGDFIEARATLNRVTRSVAFVEGRLSAGPRQVMTANGVWKRLHDEHGAAAAAFQARFGGNRP